MRNTISRYSDTEQNFFFFFFADSVIAMMFFLNYTEFKTKTVFEFFPENILLQMGNFCSHYGSKIAQPEHLPLLNNMFLVK